MTTILITDWPGEYRVAFDRKITCTLNDGQETVRAVEKSLSVPDEFGGGHVLVAGDMDRAFCFLRPFIETGKLPHLGDGKSPESLEFDACWVRPDGVFSLFGTSWVEQDLNGQFTVFGTGGNAAAGAYLAGASPERAVEIACEVDPSSGLGVRSLCVKKVSMEVES